MRRASSIREFIDDPVGRYFVGRRGCSFSHSPALFGFSSWGRADAEDVAQILHAAEAGLKPQIPPHACLIDVRGLELIEPNTLGAFIDYSRRNRETLKTKITRVAQLRPDGMIGAIIAGFSRIVPLPYPERVFGDVGDAIDWLALDHKTGVELLEELEAIRRGANESVEVVAQLRSELGRSGILTIEKAARQLGVSTRSLQRSLREAGTTYRNEIRSFQIGRAQELLQRDDRDIAEIAEEVGYSSAQHFATAYRRAIGDTPSAWRSRWRAGR